MRTTESGNGAARVLSGRFRASASAGSKAPDGAILSARGRRERAATRRNGQSRGENHGLRSVLRAASPRQRAPHVRWEVPRFPPPDRTQVADMKYLLVLTALFCTVFSSPCSAQCGSWSSAFADPAAGRLLGTAEVLHVSDGAVYAAGIGLFAPGVLAVARYSDGSWIDLGAPASGVSYLATHDDGSGRRLFASGGSEVSVWTGTNWQGTGAGGGGPLAEANFGSGAKLYRGGTSLRMWTGVGWTDAPAPSFQPHMLAAGTMASAPVLAAASGAVVATFDGATWAAYPALPAQVAGLGDADTGSGTSMHFADGPNVSPRRLRRWNGSGWEPAGPILSGVNDISFAQLSAPHSQLLLITDRDFLAGVWNAATGAWETQIGYDGFRTAASGTGGDGPLGFLAGAAGSFPYNPWQTSVIALSDGVWHPTTAGAGIPGAVNALCVATVAGQESLFEADVGSPTDSPRVSRWNGTRWIPLPTGGGTNTYLSLHGSAVGGMQRLFVGGGFTTIGGQALQANNIAAWDGSTWAALGSGANGQVLAMTTFDDGTGLALYAGGSFTSAGGQAANRIARWDGANWAALGTGVSDTVRALCVFDDGSGPQLYAAGDFTSASGQPALRVARWDGSTWTSLGSGPSSVVNAMVVHDDGSGPGLYVGGRFTSVAGFPAGRIARWQGGAWSGVSGPFNAEVRTLHVVQHDASSPPLLYAGGDFTSSGAYATGHIARWDGNSWAGFIATMDDSVRALASFGTPGGPMSLFAGGSFTQVDSIPSLHVATWTPCPGSTGTLFCPGDGSQFPCPCGNDAAPASASGCANSLGAGGALSATGAASMTLDTLLLTGAGMPNSTALYFQGTTPVAGGIGQPFGDGLRCVGGSVRRIAITQNTNGASAYPSPGAPPITVAGSVIAPGTRHYQIWYRNGAQFCNPETFNLSNGWTIQWGP